MILLLSDYKVKKGVKKQLGERLRPLLPMLHAVLPQDLQIQFLLVGIEMLLVCHCLNINKQ